MSKATAEIVDQNSLVPAQNNALTPMEMLGRAVAAGASIETLEKLMGLQERWEKNQSRKAFEAALAAAKSEIPVIHKNRTVDFTSQKGRTHYRHEDFAEIARTVDPILGRHGLSFRHVTDTTTPERVSVTCIIFGHGHSTENTLAAPIDLSGNKNPIQAIGSTVTYLQRYTLKAALGLAASEDDDARSANEAGPVNDKQADQITALIMETKSDLNRFLKWAGAESISDIPAAKFNDCVAMLKAKQQRVQQ